MARPNTNLQICTRSRLAARKGSGVSFTACAVSLLGNFIKAGDKYESGEFKYLVY